MKRSWSQIAIAVCMWLLWGYLAFVHYSEYAYKHLTLVDAESFFLHTVPNVLLPVIPILVVTLCKAKETKLIRIACGVLFFLCIPFWVLSMSYETVSAQAFCSYTEDPKDFGVYDSRIASALELNAPELFPEEIPTDAQAVKYCHFYQTSLSDTVYVAVSWQSSENDIQAIRTACSEYPMTQNQAGEEVYLLQDPDEQLQPFLKGTVIIDLESNTVGFAMTRQDPLLPEALEKVIRPARQILSNSASG